MYSFLISSHEYSIREQIQDLQLKADHHQLNQFLKVSFHIHIEHCHSAINPVTGPEGVPNSLPDVVTTSNVSPKIKVNFILSNAYHLKKKSLHNHRDYQIIATIKNVLTVSK